MDTRLQRMIVVLFLVLTLIAVTILFWLPVSDDLSRILVAKEQPSGWDSSSNLAVEVLPSENEVDEVESPLELDELTSSDVDVLADDNNLREEYDLSSSVASKSTVADSVKPTSIAPTTAALPATSPFAYDVMGNKRAHITDYSVKKNDWFSKITGRYWKDLFMWPDLYTINIGNSKSASSLRSDDPDLIYPGEKIGIYESLAADGEFSEADRKTLLSAYLKVYKIYKQIGERKDLAAAQLLAAAVRYDKDFLEKYSNVIATKDKKRAETLIKEQKFLD